MYRIYVDLKESIEDIYPGLHPDEVETIAKKIHDNWDYSTIYDEVIEQIEEIVIPEINKATAVDAA